MENAAGEYAVLAAITAALVEVVKKVDVDGKLHVFYPLFSLVIGFTLGSLSQLPWLMSLIIGVTASGAYSQIKTFAGK